MIEKHLLGTFCLGFTADLFAFLFGPYCTDHTNYEWYGQKNCTFLKCSFVVSSCNVTKQYFLNQSKAKQNHVFFLQTFFLLSWLQCSATQFPFAKLKWTIAYYSAFSLGRVQENRVINTRQQLEKMRMSFAYEKYSLFFIHNEKIFCSVFGHNYEILMGISQFIWEMQVRMKLLFLSLKPTNWCKLLHNCFVSFF